MPGPTQYVSSADAHNRLIFGAGAHYSIGADWQIVSNTSISHIRYNGDTVVGMQNTNLVVSTDFGVSWTPTSLTEPNPISIVECTNRFLALVTERFRDGDPHTPDVLKTSLLAVESNPSRDVHTNSLVLSMPKPMSLTIAAQSNVLYQVETTSDLVNPKWLPFGLPWAGTGSQLSIPLDSRTKEHAFFRVVTPPE